jgi:precorrin-2 C20-methyltransferase / precorrin-3B C17-methyltransferase
VVGRAVGTPGQQVTVTTLGDLDPGQVDMQCLLIVGSSQTRVLRNGTRAPRVITPRRYPG